MKTLEQMTNRMRELNRICDDAPGFSDAEYVEWLELGDAIEKLEG